MRAGVERQLEGGFVELGAVARPRDGSEQSFRAVSLATSIAEGMKANLIFAHVVVPALPPENYYGLSADEFHRQERMAMEELCAHLFKDFQFGLSLIKKNTGRKNFVLDAAAVDAPDKFLSELVLQSYYPVASTEKA